MDDRCKKNSAYSDDFETKTISLEMILFFLLSNKQFYHSNEDYFINL